MEPSRDSASDPLARLAEWYARGQVVLFTGAGFSYGASDLAGRPIPQVRELTEELWRLAYPEADFPESADVGDLYEVALRRSKRQLTALLRARLDVDPDTLDRHFETWFSMPWRIVYTLNVDNLDEAAQRVFDLPRPIRAVSALDGDLTLGGGSDLINVHVNGLRDEIPDVTFSPMQYAERAAIPEPLYGQLVTDLLSFPVVYVGTELRESPLWAYIKLRGSRGGRGVTENRPRSFLVAPSVPDERVELLEEFNITWLPMTAETFAEEVLERLTDEKRRGLAAISARATSSKRRVAFDPVLDLAALPAEPVSEYLLGARPTWGDITSGRAVARDFEAELDPDLLPTCVVVTGTAGVGTTSTMMQLALRIARTGANALWLTSRSCPAHEVGRAIAGLTEESVVFIDDADDLGRALEGLLTDVRGLPNVRLFLGLRAGRLDDVLGGWRPDAGDAFELIVPPLDNSDVDRLLDALDRDNKLGDLKGRPREAQRRILIRESGRQLLVAMIKATSGKELEEKVASEMNGLAQPHQRLYGVLAISTQLRHRLTRDEVLQASDALDNEGVAALSQLCARRLVNEVDHSYELRHRVIAEIATTELRHSGRAVAPYSGLARVLAAKHRAGDRSSRVGRLAISLISHRRVTSFFDVSQARHFYQELEEFMSDDYHFLLQRGSYELDHGSLARATNYLQQARQLGMGDHRVETEWAHLLMKRAIDDPAAPDAAELVEEASAILLDQIDRLGASDRHPFHLFGSQMLAWLRRSTSLTVDEKRVVLRKAVEVVQAGASKHPGDRDLRHLAESLQRELLMTAVNPT